MRLDVFYRPMLNMAGEIFSCQVVLPMADNADIHAC